MATIYDTILWLRSRATGKRFPVVEFTADTDMPTAGWVSLTSTRHTEVVITELTDEEYRATASEPATYSRVEARVNGALNRDDLRCSWLVHVEEIGPSGAGISFQEFLKVRQPPKLLYRDIFDPDGLAEEDGRSSRVEFEEQGGRVSHLP